MNLELERQDEHGGVGATVGEQPTELSAVLERASQGDESAWRRIVELYARRVYALCKSRLGGAGKSAREVWSDGFVSGSDPAEEVTQSVFVTVASKMRSGEYTEQGRFEAWLFRVAMNRIRDEVRRVKRQASPVDNSAFAEVGQFREPDADATRPVSSDALDVLRRAMDELPDSDREVVELRHHAGLSFKQIADHLDEPLGTLLARHHRALRKLKDILGGARAEADLLGEQ